jgi:predicted Zn finger-like uncharacterized protein
VIVTCPGCASKYRVRDEAVPPGGAELKCPSCGAVFVAHAPKHSEAEIAAALDGITKAKELAEKKLAEVDAQRADLERRLRETEAQVPKLEAQLLVLKSELQGAQSSARKMAAPNNGELLRLRAENARVLARVAEADARAMQVAEELARVRGASNQGPEVQRLLAELSSAQKTTGRLATELNVERQSVARLEAELHNARSSGSTTAAAPLNGGAIPASLSGLISALGPMLWGLEQAIKYLEPFSANEAALAAHVRQLQLLHVVLQRLQREGSR